MYSIHILFIQILKWLFQQLRVALPALKLLSEKHPRESLLPPEHGDGLTIRTPIDAKNGQVVHQDDGTKTESSQHDDTVTAIMDVLEKFSFHQEGKDFVGRRVFSPRVRRHVSAGRNIPMVIPVFPAKSINLVDKVLGVLPDLGVELALDRLNDLCKTIGEVYEPGASLLIATDGACYNGMKSHALLYTHCSLTSQDLTGVSANNLWEYGVELRKMVIAKGYTCIEFISIMNLLGSHTDSEITKERFISLLEPSRRELESRYGDPNFDARACIQNDPDYKTIYDGYAKFMKRDLAHGIIRSSMQEVQVNGTRDCQINDR